MSREMQHSGINFYLMPHDRRERYGHHVRMRMRMEAFCLLVHAVAALCVRLRPPRPYDEYLSDKADVQLAVGVYPSETGQKIEAVQLCNTSFLSDRFLGDLALQSKAVSVELHAFCTALRRTSGTTTP